MKKRVIIILLCIITITTLTGCSVLKKAKNKIHNVIKTEEKTKKKEEKKTPEKKVEIKDLVGKYELVEMISKEKSYTREDLQALKSINLTVTIELKEDKSAILDLFGSKQNFKYDEEYFYSNDDIISFTLDNNILKLYNSEESLTFEKIK